MYWNIIHSWFKKDDNASPPEYVLQPISYGYPDVRSEDQDKSNAAWDLWVEASDRIQEMLIQGAKKYMEGTNPAHNYQVLLWNDGMIEGIDMGGGRKIDKFVKIVLFVRLLFLFILKAFRNYDSKLYPVILFLYGFNISLNQLVQIACLYSCSTIHFAKTAIILPSN